MKKLVSSIIILLLLLTIGTTVVNAAGCNVNVEAKNTNPKIGESVVVTISFSVPVGTASLTLNYNKDVLQYAGSSATNAVNSGSSIKLDYIDGSFKNNTISSITVEFTAKAEGTANLSASGVTISNAKAEELQPSVTGGSTVTVKTNNSSSGNQGGNSNNNQGGSSNNSTNKPNSNNNTSKGPTFQSVNDTVSAKEWVRIRESWSTTSRILGSLERGQTLTRTGIGNNNWDRVIYNGKVAYINHSYLEVVSQNEPDNDTEDENNNEIQNEISNSENIMEENQINNLVANETVKGGETRSKNKTTYIWYIIIVLIIIAIIIIIARLRKKE